MPCAFEGEYHDTVWGTRVTDSRELFSQLSLCTQQCGVSWKVVWNKRHHYRDAFRGWDMRAIARMTEEDIDALCDKEGPWAGKVLQNRAKLSAILHNARQCVEIDERVPGGLSAFLWSIVERQDRPAGDGVDVVRLDGRAESLCVDPRCVNHCVRCEGEAYRQVFGVTSEFSDRLAAVLKKTSAAAADERCGLFGAPFKFLGSVTLQAFMLQCGLLNGHACDCARSPLFNCAAASAATPTGARASASGRRRREEAEPPHAPLTTANKRRRGRQPAAASTDDVWL